MALLKPLLLAAALAVATPALAHVGVDPGEAKAGAYQVLRFRVGHGCGDAATTALRIETPQGLASARPQPKPGWTLAIEKQGERVSALVWRGALPADQFDEFAVLAKLPAEPGVLYFPTVQTCGGEESQWTGIPDPGEARLSHPAPALLVLPAKPAETHQH
ncbi:MAG: YcnI family protein [Pseudomonadota bacterium]